MESLEIKEMLDMNYDNLVEHLLKKYGGSKYDYFANEKCRTKNTKVTRGKEGLFCHHIDEDKAKLLGNMDFAILSPFEYQKADRLVYCNILEHLILHIKIFEKTKDDKDNKDLGYRGAVVFIIPKINDYYNGVIIEKDWEKIALDLIKDDFDDYINVLKFFMKLAKKYKKLELIINPLRLSLGTDNNIVKKILSKL